MRPLFQTLLLGTALASLLGFSGCDDAAEAVRVERSVAPALLDSGTITNDLGYEIEVTEFRAAVQDLVMSRNGEEQLSLWQSLKGLVVGRARAHPGHSSGGEVTGELLGHLLVDFSPGAAPSQLGMATLITGDYDAFSFTFRAAGGADDVAAGLAATDPLVGHAAVISGTATKDGVSTSFTMALDPTDTPTVSGAVFDATVTPTGNEALRLKALLVEPTSGETLFDGVDFAAMDTDGDGSLAVAAPDETHNRVVRALHSHDFYVLTQETSTP